MPDSAETMNQNLLNKTRSWWNQPKIYC